MVVVSLEALEAGGSVGISWHQSWQRAAHCLKAEFLEIILVSHDLDCHIQGLKAR